VLPPFLGLPSTAKIFMFCPPASSSLILHF
jgi:hypothetical protein